MWVITGEKVIDMVASSGIVVAHTRRDGQTNTDAVYGHVWYGWADNFMITCILGEI